MKHIDFANILMIMLAAVTLSVSCGGGGSGDSASAEGGSAAPQTPSRIIATEGQYTSSVRIEWDAVDGAEYYVIYKSVDNRDQFRVVASNIKTAYYIDEKVTPNRIYYYKVAAGTGTTWSSPSIDTRGFAHTGKPFSPERVNASSDTIGYISLKWTSVPQADSYKVMRSESPDGSYTGLAVDLPSSQTEYKDESSLVRDRKYYYQIIAVNEEGESDPGEPVYGISLQDIPPAPEGLTASDGTYGNKVELKWNASVNAVTYTVYRARDENGSAEKYEKIAGNITALLLEDVTALPDVTYHYVVTALSSGGESEPGTGATGKITTGAPIQTSAPINVTASDGNYDTITVAWSAVDGASGYSVYRCDTINGTYTLITASDKTTLTSFTDTPPSHVIRYYYKVTAWSSGVDSIESYKSIPDDGYAMPQLPDVPAGLTATSDRTDASIIISWPASERTGSYRLYRAESADGTYNLLASGITELTYTDEYPSISAGKTYYYKITAVNVSGESAQSSYATGNTVFATPAGLTLSYNKSAKQTTISWTGVRGAVSYKIQRKIDVYSTSWKDFTTTDSLTITDSDLKWGVIHHYKVQALNEVSSSAFSSAEDIYVIW